MRLHTVRAKLFAGMGSVIAAFIVLSLVVVAQVTDEFGEEEISRNLQLGRDAFGGYLQTSQLLLQDKGRLLANSPHLKTTLSMEDLDYETAFHLTGQLADVGKADLLLLVDGEGTLLADATSETSQGNCLRQFPVIARALAGNECVAVWEWNEQSFFVAVTPVIANESVLGLLVLGQQLDHHFADQVRRATGCEVLLFHQDDCLAESYARDRMSSSFAPHSVLAACRDRSGHNELPVRLEAHGETKFFSRVLVDDLSIVLARSLEDFSGFSQHARQRLLILGVGVAASACLVCLVISQRLSRPIAELVHASKEMAAGNLSAGVTVHRDDELGRLSASFNTMARRIEKLVHDVQEAAKIVRQASQAKSNFLSLISHELRTPLNSVIGFNELLLEDAETASNELSDATKLEWFRTIDANGHKLLKIVEDVLDVAKLEQNQLTVELAPCSPMSVLLDVMDRLRPLAEKKGLQIDLISKPGVPEIISSDTIRFGQMVFNVVENAIKFTRVGFVCVTAELVRTGDNARLRVIVSDSGIGIPADRLEAIFEPFVQVDGSMTREFGGTGLGLSISRKIAEALDGSVTVSSQMGCGSAFELEIGVGTIAEETIDSDAESFESLIDDDTQKVPARADFIQTPTRKAVEGSMAPLTVDMLSERVLVVDDTAANRRLVSLILRKGGATVIEASDGQQALDAYDAAPCDVILMDMQMPILDGYAATREFRRRGVTIPIIALTAHAMVNDRGTCLAAGCSSYLTKPVSPHQLIEAVTTALKSKKAEVPLELV